MTRVNRTEILRTLRRQKLFTLTVIAAIAEITVFFSLGLHSAKGIPSILIGALFFASIFAFAVYYVSAVLSVRHEFFWSIRMHHLGAARRVTDFVTRLKWPIFEIGPHKGRLTQALLAPINLQFESTRVFAGYYVMRYAKSLKRKLASPSEALVASHPHIRLLYKPTEHYYFDSETLKSFEIEEPKNGSDEKLEPYERTPIVEKQDSLYLLLLTGIAFTSTVIGTYFGSTVLRAILPFLLCLFCIPFYRGYLMGSLRDDFAARLKGWENVVLLSIMFPNAAIASWYLLPLLYRVLLAASGLTAFSWWGPLRLLIIGFSGFLLIMVVIFLGVAVVRVVATELAKFYFDCAPERRYDILSGMSVAGDERKVQANCVLSAMLHQETVVLPLGSEVLLVQDGMVESQKFIVGAYGKGWNWFLDIFVLCFALVGVFSLLMSVP